MAKVALINITGIILPEDYIWWDMEATSLYRVKQQVQAAGEFDSIQLNICSPGGYCREGWAIVEYLYMFGKPINTLAYGQCMSFGTVFHAMGTVRETTKYCEWMYHRPWDYCAGNDLQVAKFNAGLAKETTKIFGFYAEQIGKPIDEITTLIQEDDLYLSPQEAIDNGFATGFHTPGAMASQANTTLPGFTAPLDPAKMLKPVYLMSLKDYKINPDAPKEEPVVEGGAAAPKGSQSNFNSNTNSITMATIKQQLKAAAQSALDFLNGTGIKDLDVALTDGRTMVTDSTGDAPVVGDTAEIDGATAPDGDYSTEKFGKITIAGGAISTITEEDTTTTDTGEGDGGSADIAVDDPSDSPAVVALKKEVRALRASAKAQDNKITEMGRRMTAVLGAMTSQEVPTQANRIVTTSATGKQATQELSEREQMLAEHVAKYTPKTQPAAKA